MKSYAVIDPWAMMIHIHDTFGTYRAVMGSLGFKIMADNTIFPRSFYAKLS